MEMDAALAVIAQHRRDSVVITTMSSVGAWPRHSDTPLDFAYMPSSMGQGPALGLGLALAQSPRGVIVISGDGSLLMNLGCLVTLGQYPSNLFLVIMDNALYEVTGGQATVGAGQVDFSGLARAAGITRSYAFQTLKDWHINAAEALAGQGPVAICLKIDGKLGQSTPQPPRPMVEQIARLRSAIGVKT